MEIEAEMLSLWGDFIVYPTRERQEDMLVPSLQEEVGGKVGEFSV